MAATDLVDGKAARSEWRPAWLRGFWGQVFLALAAVTALYTVWTFTHWGGEDRAVLISDVAILLPNLVSVIAAWAVAADPRQLDDRVRRVWLLMALAQICQLAANSLWLYFEVIAGQAPFPSLADPFYLALYPLFLLALLNLPGAPRRPGERLAAGLDLAIVMVAAWMAVWRFIIEPTMAAYPADPGSQALAAAYPVGDLLVLAGALTILFRQPAPAVRATLGLFLISMLAFLAADLVYAAQELSGDYVGGSVTDLGWWYSFLFFTAAALRQRYTGAAQALEQQAGRWLDRAVAAAPYLSVVFGYGVVLGGVVLAALNQLAVREILAGTAVLTGLVVARQILAFRDRMRLSQELAEALERQQSFTGNLEMLVAARTRDLTLATEIGQALTQEHNLDDLLSRAVELIRERFGLYHVQVYLADGAGRSLRLQASTGEAGRTLLYRQHRLPVDLASVNGTAAAQRRSVLVADTRASSGFRGNPLLPDTRCEMAVPLLAADRLLGVLDLQSAQVNGLTLESERAFALLALQLAAAMDNSRLFAQLEQARAQVEVQARRLTRASWAEYLDEVEQTGQLEVGYAPHGVDPQAPLDPDAPVFERPLLVAGEPVGRVLVEGEAGRVWQAEEVELAGLIARQAAQQMESLRVLAQAEQYRHEAESTLRRLTREGWRDYAEATGLRRAYVYEAEHVQPAETPGGHGWARSLMVRGEAIGELEVETETLSAEAEAVLAAVASQLSTHLEALRLGEATQLALAQTEELYRLTGRLNTAQSLSEVLSVLAGLDGAPAGALGLAELTAAGRPLALNWVAGWPAGSPALEPQPAAALADLAARQEPWLADDLTLAAALPAAVLAAAQALGGRSLAGLPLAAAGQWLGLVLLVWPEPRAFTHQDRLLYRAVAAQAAVVINNRVLFEQTRQRADREAIINTITQKIQGTVTVQGALETAVHELGAALRARRASVALAGPAPAGREQ